MYYLAQSLAQYGEVSIHEWDDRTVVPEARRHSGKLVIVGFSLGANTAVAIANKLPHVDLLVAYDPSRLSPLVHAADGAFTQPVTPTVRRAICFYNPYAWYFGGARLEGSQVEIIPIINYHLAVAVDQRLHEITEDAVRKLAITPPAKEPSLFVAASRPSTAGMKSVEASIARMDLLREPTPFGPNQETVVPNGQRKISFP
jgi:pimeloyl-ACP methyl ester carboxylesterase